MASPESSADGGVLVGVCEGVEVGDYVHLLFRPDGGETQSYWCTAACADVEENPDAWRGRRARLTWEMRRFEVPEAPGDDSPAPVVVALEALP